LFQQQQQKSKKQQKKLLQKEKRKGQQPEEERSEPEGREELSRNQKLEKLLDFFSGCPARQLDAAYALFCSNQNGDYSSVDSSGRGDGSGEEDCGGTGNDAPTGAK
jgi:hypothetical protein